jgi:hypothetical protein
METSYNPVVNANSRWFFPRPEVVSNISVGVRSQVLPLKPKSHFECALVGFRTGNRAKTPIGQTQKISTAAGRENHQTCKQSNEAERKNTASS